MGNSVKVKEVEIWWYYSLEHCIDTSMDLLLGTVIVVNYNLRYLPLILEDFEKSGASSFLLENYYTRNYTTQEQLHDDVTASTIHQL